MRKLQGILTLLLVTGMAVPALGSEKPRDTYPESGAEAMALYESDVDSWADGPVAYIMLDGERDMFGKLETSAERAEFIEWFWDRRDPERDDDTNLMRDAFYERVAYANSRYNEFPKGWKSDRGQLNIVLGKPDHVRPQSARFSAAEGLIWTYYTIGPRADTKEFGSVFGSMTIPFVKAGNRNRYEIYGGFGGRGHFPLYVREAMAYTNIAAISDDPTRQALLGSVR